MVLAHRADKEKAALGREEERILAAMDAVFARPVKQEKRKGKKPGKAQR